MTRSTRHRSTGTWVSNTEVAVVAAVALTAGGVAMLSSLSDAAAANDGGRDRPAARNIDSHKGSDSAQQSILGNSCNVSGLRPHNGFQDGNRCVSTEFGEVGSAENNPSLLITSAPREIGVGQPFELGVSTRNLVRDRFPAAKQGGYYRESSFLNSDGLVRGHFHTACRMLTSLRSAPDPAPPPAAFVATEDGGGGRSPDTVAVRIAGLPERGEAQCAVWAGDGSHRVPMMQRANQIPAFDAVRITVR